MKAEIEIYQTAFVVPGDGEEVLAYKKYESAEGGYFKMLRYDGDAGGFVDDEDESFFGPDRVPLWCHLPAADLMDAFINRMRGVR